MVDVFIAHVEEDADIALELALRLEEAGYLTWCYEVDSIPGPSYLMQTGKAVEQSKAIVVIISPHSLSSRQVTKEIVRGHESDKEFIPLLHGITHIEFQNRQPEWREAIGAASSIRITSENISALVPRIISGLKGFGILPGQKSDSTRIKHIKATLDEVLGQTGEIRAELPASDKRAAYTGASVKPAPEIKATGTPRQIKWIKPAIIISGIVVVIAVLSIVLLNYFQPQSSALPSDVPTITPSDVPAASTAPAEETVTFIDSKVEAVIRGTISKPSGPVYVSDMEGIKYLEAKDKSISDLSDLKYCKNLNVLRLVGNKVADLSPVVNLTNLTELNLNMNNITDISPLKTLKRLSELYLTNNNISDISPLAGLTLLRSVLLSFNNISNICPLVENEGISDDDIVSLFNNPLNSTSVDICIPQLLSRGVRVTYSE